MKKFFAIFLAIALCIVGTTTAFASETERDPEPTRMWASGTYVVPAYSSVDTGTFSLTDRYFAFEMSATSSSSGTYTVALKRSGVTKASATKYVNSGIFKKDWITITSGSHYFTITNNTSASITVTLTYYSWA